MELFDDACESLSTFVLSYIIIRQAPLAKRRELMPRVDFKPNAEYDNENYSPMLPARAWIFSLLDYLYAPYFDWSSSTKLL